MNRTLVTLALAATLAIATTAAAESVSATMQVSTQVIARAIVTVDSQPDGVEITEADVARGYVDVETPLQWRGKTNSRSGYLLQVVKSSDSFSAVDLSFANTNMHVSQEGWVARPYVPGGEALLVKARLILNAATRIGRHALPISVTATPL